MCRFITTIMPLPNLAGRLLRRARRENHGCSPLFPVIQFPDGPGTGPGLLRSAAWTARRKPTGGPAPATGGHPWRAALSGPPCGCRVSKSHDESRLWWLGPRSAGRAWHRGQTPLRARDTLLMGRGRSAALGASVEDSPAGCGA